ncbi:recombinase family protein [Acidobacteria bacterium AH-259-A15]|nr:recombinase family protein [Acidobacteria bacterium AH-259-A15]
MKNYFGYIRVSTAKQGEHGVSLQEQRDAITRYAQRNTLKVITWFEERQSAAKRGRSIFTQMMKLLKKGKADGVIIHKIDRSARNLKDWADLGELIDQGIEVHFANETLDLRSRGGRLSADIQAVVAADYIRNLREETRKGLYGRLKQGIYPLPAPLGYKDMGAGRPKELDPTKAPLVRKAFELYAGSGYNLDSLVEELFRLGLRNRNGYKVSRNGLSTLLNNPFYIGVIRLKRTGETFQGAHHPLIRKSLFDQVQRILEDKTNTQIYRHNFLFRRLLSCARCEYSLIGERQKGHVYYRCHTKNCPTTGIREEPVEEQVLQKLTTLQFTGQEKAYVQKRVARLRDDWEQQCEVQIKALTLNLDQTQDRLCRLTDAYLDGVIEKELFEERKKALLMERKDWEEKLAELKDGTNSVPDRLAEFLELAGNAYLKYKMGLPEEKRDLLRIVTSNRLLMDKSVVAKLASPFSEVANRFQNSNGTPYRDVPRTWDRLIPILMKRFATQPQPSFLGTGTSSVTEI